MSQDDLHDIANHTSPREIEIPNSWQALIVWAIAKFGVGIIATIVLGYAVSHVYLDLTALNTRVLTAFELQTQAATANREAVLQMAETLRRIETEHRDYKRIQQSMSR